MTALVPSRHSIAGLIALALSLAAPASAGPTKAAQPAKPAEAPADAAPEAEGEGEGELDEAAAQAAVMKELGFKEGPFTGPLGTVAQVAVPEGWTFTEAAGAKKFLELSENVASGRELGVMLAPGGEEWVLFSFEDTGYVKDDDKEDLDADAMLDSIKEGTAEANKRRKELNQATIEIVGWEKAPAYDAVTHNLEWAPRGKVSDGGDVVNYNTRLLGRRGVMEVSLIGDPAGLKEAMPAFRDLLKGFAFKAGQDYASFQQGDRVAEYGLAALVTGGAVAVAAKSGLLGKLWKVIVLGAAGLVAAVRKLFTRKNDSGNGSA